MTLEKRQSSKMSFGLPSNSRGLRKQGSSTSQSAPQQTQIKKRDSKRMSKASLPDQEEQKRVADLLARYNDLKAIQEGKELPIRQVYLRRIGLKLVRIKAAGIPAPKRPAYSEEPS